MKHDALIPVFVEYIPEDDGLEKGKLYISLKYGSVIHHCCCGCGLKVAMPIKPVWPDGWEFEQDGDLVSFSPSIGNWQFPCRSHYYIKKNQVIWCD